MDFREIVRARLDEKGLNKYQAARQANLPQDAIRYVLAGHVPRLDRAQSICDALGLELQVVVSEQKAPSEKAAPESQTFAHPRPTNLAVFESALREFLMKMVNLDPAMFSSGEADADGLHPIGDGWFRHDWMLRQGAHPSTCGMTAVEGRGMEPTIPDGSAVLVDRSRCEKQETGIFLLWHGGARLARRFRKRNRRWEIYGDHPKCDASWLARSDRVIGQIMWSAREHHIDVAPHWLLSVEAAESVTRQPA